MIKPLLGSFVLSWLHLSSLFSSYLSIYLLLFLPYQFHRQSKVDIFLPIQNDQVTGYQVTYFAYLHKTYNLQQSLFILFLQHHIAVLVSQELK